MIIDNTHIIVDDTKDLFRDQANIIDNLDVEKLVDYPSSDDKEKKDDK